jgi:opacity protein-like surface antigen
MKMILTTVALAALAASPAFAATHKRTAHPVAAPSQGYGAYASTLGRDTVVVDGSIVGRDPDAGIRLQLRHDPDSRGF